MSSFTDFFPAAGGGGGIPKYQEFTSSGTFTPTQALIDAGGRLSYLIVGAGERGSGTTGGSGGDVKWGYATITSTTNCAATIGAGGNSSGADGGSSSVAFSSAGGADTAAAGGSRQGSGVNWGAAYGGYFGATGNSGTFGFGKGGNNAYGFGGVYSKSEGGDNSGCGTSDSQDGGNGFIRLTWFE